MAGGGFPPKKPAWGARKAMQVVFARWRFYVWVLRLGIKRTCAQIYLEAPFILSPRPPKKSMPSPPLPAIQTVVKYGKISDLRSDKNNNLKISNIRNDKKTKEGKEVYQARQRGARCLIASSRNCILTDWPRRRLTRREFAPIPCDRLTTRLLIC